MEHNCNYDKTHLLMRLQAVLWRMNTYCADAKKAGHPLCEKMYRELEHDLRKHSKKLESAISGLAKEGKYNFCEKC